MLGKLTKRRSFVQNCNQVESNSLTKSDECACWAELNWELIKLLNCRVMSCMHRVVYAGIYEVFIHGISRINNLLAVKFEVEIWWTWWSASSKCLKRYDGDWVETKLKIIVVNRILTMSSKYRVRPENLRSSSTVD